MASSCSSNFYQKISLYIQVNVITFEIRQALYYLVSSYGSNFFSYFVLVIVYSYCKYTLVVRLLLSNCLQILLSINQSINQSIIYFDTLPRGAKKFVQNTNLWYYKTSLFLTPHSIIIIIIIRLKKTKQKKNTFDPYQWPIICLYVRRENNTVWGTYRPHA